VNGDFRVFRRAGVKSFTHPGLRFVTALAVARLAVLRTSRGRADRLRRRSARCRTALLTSRYPLAFDDRGAREESGRGRIHSAMGTTAPSPGARGSHRHTAARPARPISRPVGGTPFPGGLATTFLVWAENAWPLMPPGQPGHFIPASIHAGLTGESLLPSRNCAAAPDGPGTGSAGPRRSPEIYCRQYAGAKSGYRVTIVRLCPMGGFRCAPANVAHIGRSRARNACRTVTAAGPAD
jgi:hypothetical protein